MENNMETKYSFVSQYLFINFLNTINIKKITAIDFLEEKRGIDDWLAFLGSQEVLNLQQVEKLKSSPVEAKELKVFRDQWRNYFSTDQRDKSSLDSLVAHTTKVPLYFNKVCEPIPSKGGTEGLLALLSYDMLLALQSGVFEKIKKCESSLCYAFFVDISGKRKWCSMEICGNREKARRHYSKKIKE
ncbi:CGNR zinc finger domain-containing protein [Planococcus sp. ANT_H30]|nr:CGNR zinc finger domain-containing protein [Planococcus sp. ANT_H30]